MSHCQHIKPDRFKSLVLCTPYGLPDYSEYQTASDFIMSRPLPLVERKNFEVSEKPDKARCKMSKKEIYKQGASNRLGYLS